MPIYMSLEGIVGPSDDKSIPVLNWSFGASNPTTVGSGGGGGGVGKVSVSDLSVMISMDKASPVLFLSCCTGAHIKTGQLTMTSRDGKSAPITIKITDILVTSFQVMANAHGDELPAVQINLNFATVGVTAFGVSKGWDVKQNKPG